MAELKVEITLYGLTMIAIGSCIGSGIFLTPSDIAAHLPSSLLIFLVWGLGGIITLSGALTFAELGGLFPQAGGVYVYLKEAFGDLFGFLYGWAYLAVISSGAIAALCIACARYLAFLVPLGSTGVKIIALSLIVIITAINVLRAKAGEVFSIIFTGLKLVGISAVVVVGLFWGRTSLSFGSDPGVRPAGSLAAAFGLALIGVLWSYGGWQHATFVAGEARNARRTVPRAMIIGALVVTAVYLSTNVAYLCLLPIEAIAASDSLAAEAVSTVIPFGGALIAVIIAISTFGTAGIYTLSSPRLYYAMAQDGLFFTRIAEVHKGFRTPVYAIVLQSSWAMLLLLFWGTFEDVITYVVFTDWIFFGLTAAAIFVFRHKRKGQHRPYKTFGYPLTPLIFVGVTALFVVNTLVEKPLHAWSGLILMAVGSVIYVYFKRRKKTYLLHNGKEQS